MSDIATLGAQGWDITNPPRKGSVVLASSAAPVSLTGTTVESVMALVNIPPSGIAQHGRGRVKTFWQMTSNTNAKTPRIRLGGLAGIELANGNITTAVPFATLSGEFMNAGGGNIIYFQDWLAGGNVAAIGGTGGTVAMNMALAQPLVITGQLAAPGDTLTLLGYSFEALNI